ncbi:MAG: DMT family transporter [Chloroflexi bacterium]|nr:DMT family transporter [Chloroflexota bacterium]MBT4073520.1 DMT family transporter [Chloroflexota bacterium]MBT4515123.1 DMT family transporter [Chloroflexota bacterium]MBT6681383.1 DMT family transporter [Chloroflexota bacterium]
MRSTTRDTAQSPENAPFTSTDWSLLAGVSLIWGSAFLWTAVALEGFSAETVALLRVALGAAGLAAFPSARKRIDREDWPKLLVVAIAGNAGPALLFAMAIETVDSAVAGMAVSATPLASLVIWILLKRSLPAGIQLTGLAIGFAGVTLMAAPNLVGVQANPVGIGWLGLAVLGYGITQHVIGPLQRKYGATTVIFWALLIGSVGLLPMGLAGLSDSEISASTLIAIIVLGVIATGVARSLAATLTGRVGPVRGSIHTYFIPVLAVVLGVALRGEHITPAELIGLPIALAGGYLVTQRSSDIRLSKRLNRWLRVLRLIPKQRTVL